MDYELSDSAGSTIEMTHVDLYSDYNYWKIWLMGSWFIDDHLSIDVIANYEPETHTEDTDDSALGFASVRLVWHP